MMQWFYFIAYSFMAFLCGFVASIMVEFPFFGLEKLIFPQRRGRESSKASNNVTNEGHDNQALELQLPGMKIDAIPFSINPLCCYYFPNRSESCLPESASCPFFRTGQWRG